MTDEIEPIVLVFPTTQQRFTLRPETAARVWDAVNRRSDKTQTPEDYVIGIIESYLSILELSEGTLPKPESPS